MPFETKLAGKLDCKLSSFTKFFRKLEHSTVLTKDSKVWKIVYDVQSCPEAPRLLKRTDTSHRVMQKLK